MKALRLILGLALGALAGGAAGFLLAGPRGGDPAAAGELAGLRREVASLRSRLGAPPRPEAAARTPPPAMEEASAPAGDEKSEDDAAAGVAPPQASIEEIAAMREELETWRSLPGATERLLKTIADAAVTQGQRLTAVIALFNECDLPAHFHEVIAALDAESDPLLRVALRASIGRMAGKFHSAELHDALLDDIRKGPNPAGPGEAASRMLAEYHGVEGIDRISSLLDDESADIRRAAAGAFGHLLVGATAGALRAAESSPDPWVRGLSALHLAALGEGFGYPALADDWREVAVNARHYELEPFFYALRDPGGAFGRLTPDDSLRLEAFLEELSERCPDKRARESASEILGKMSGAR
jgi:hypothetical protein